MRSTKWICCLSLTISGCLPSSSSPQEIDHHPEIPFELYDENLIVLSGDVGSVKNVNILVDTGTNPTAISTEIADQLNLHGRMEALVSSSGQINVQSVILPRIDIGALHRTSIRVVVQDLGYLQRSLGISIGAIAGLDVLSSHSFLIDYWKRKIVFAAGKPARKSVEFETERPFLTVKAKIGGQELRLLVDTATPRLLLFRKGLNANLASLEPLANDRNAVIFTFAGTMRAGWFRAPDISLGARNIGPQIMLVADRDPDGRYEFDGLLGLANTGFQKVWLDFEHGLFGWK